MATRRDVVLAAVGGIIVGAGAVLLSDMRSNKKKKIQNKRTRMASRSCHRRTRTGRPERSHLRLSAESLMPWK